jgi:hypothetical protein
MRRLFLFCQRNDEVLSNAIVMLHVPVMFQCVPYVVQISLFVDLLIGDSHGIMPVVLNVGCNPVAHTISDLRW